MSISDNSDFLLSLGYDPTDAQKGLEQAIDDLQNFGVQAAQLSAELNQKKAALDQDYTAQSLKASRDRSAALSTEISNALSAYQKASASEQVALAQKIRDLNDERLANQNVINGYNQEIEKINQLKASYAGLQSQIRQTRAAKSVLAPQAKSEGGALGKALGSVNVGEVLQATGILGLGASIPFAVHDIGKSIKDEVMGLGEYAEELTLASQKTGMTVRELQQFDAIGKSVGLTTDDMVTAMRKFSEAVVSTAQVEKQGSTKGLTETAARSAQLMKQLGVSVTDAAGNMKSTQDIFLQLADAFQKLPDGATKSAIAVQLLGRSGLNMIPFLDKGSAGIKEILSNFDGLFPELSKTAEQFDNLRIAQAEYEAASKNLGNTFAQDILPFLASTYEKLAALMGLMANTGTIQGFGYSLKYALGISANPPASTSEANTITSALAGQKVQVDRGEFQQRTAAFRMLQNPTSLSESVNAVTNPYAYSEAASFSLNGTYQAAQAEFKRRNPNAKRSASPEELAALSMIIDKRYEVVKAVNQETEAQKKLEDQLQQTLTAETRGAGDAQAKAEAKARETILNTAAAGQGSLADARLAQQLTPRALLTNELGSAQNNLQGLQKSAETESGDKLLENLRQQNELTKQIYELKVKIVDLAQKEEKASEELSKESEEVAASFQKQAKEAQKVAEVSIKDFNEKLPPSAPARPKFGATPTAEFSSQFETISATKEVDSFDATESATQAAASQEIAALSTLDSKLQDEISARMQAKEITGEQLTQLTQMIELVKRIGEEIKEASKQTPFGQFTQQIKSIDENVGKYDPKFKTSNFGLYAAGVESLGNFGSTVEKAGGGKEGDLNFSEFLKGLKEIFGNTQKFLSSLPSIMGPLMPFLSGNPAVGGAAAGASLAGGAVSGLSSLSSSIGSMFSAVPGLGTAISLGGAAIGGIFGMQQKQSSNIAKDIKNQVNDILDALRSGSQGIGATIQQLEQQRDQAIAQLSGSKSGKKELQNLLPDLDQQIADLQGQQQQLLDQFHQNLAALSIPEDAGRDTITQIQQIADALKQAAQAGASAAEQMQYLDEAMNDLKVSIQNDLLNEEQTTLGLLQKEIDLQQQKSQLINQTYAQQKSIADSLALNRAQTPAQSAALQIRETGIQSDYQLQQLDQQQQLLEAQIDGQAQLFGWDLQDLQTADAKTKLLQQQVALQQQLTAQTVAQIKANQSFLGQLNAGNIPALPPGSLPSNFTWPTGGAYSPTPGATGAYNPNAALTGTTPSGVTININVNGGNPSDIVDALQNGLRLTNLSSQLGYQ